MLRHRFILAECISIMVNYYHNHGRFMKKKLVLPKFKNEDEEREFWDKIDLSDYLEPSDFVPVSFPNLKLTADRDRMVLRDKRRK